MFASIPRWLRIVVYTQLALVFAIPFGGWILQRAGEAADMRTYPPPGQLVDVGGHLLHLYCVGERGDGPLVVFNADLGDSGLVWRGVQDQLNGRLRSCAIDRAGLGWSEAGTKDRSITATSRELYNALTVAGEAGPYLAVGHGLGALHVALMAREHPTEVSGLVLVDPHPPDCLKDRFEGILALVPVPSRTAIRTRLDEVIDERGACPDGEGGTPLLAWLARIGMVRALAGKNFDPTSPSVELLPLHRALKLRTQAIEATLLESKTAYVGLAEGQAAFTHLTTLPVQVISRGRMGNFPEDQEFLTRRADPDTLAFERAQLQYDQERHAEMIARDSNAERSFASESGHYVPVTQPELVADAIVSMLPASRIEHDPSREMPGSGL